VAGNICVVLRFQDLSNKVSDIQHPQNAFPVHTSVPYFYHHFSCSLRLPILGHLAIWSRSCLYHFPCFLIVLSHSVIWHRFCLNCVLCFPITLGLSVIWHRFCLYCFPCFPIVLSLLAIWHRFCLCRFPKFLLFLVFPILACFAVFPVPFSCPAHYGQQLLCPAPGGSNSSHAAEMMNAVPSHWVLTTSAIWIGSAKWVLCKTIVIGWLLLPPFSVRYSKRLDNTSGFQFFVLG